MIKFGLSGGLIAYALNGIDFADAAERIGGLSALALLVIPVFAVQFLIGAARWYWVLDTLRAGLSFARTFAILYVGIFFSIVLPGAVGGDAVRMWQTSRAGVPVPTAVSSVMLERVATVLGLVLLVAATQPILMDRIGPMPGWWIFPLLSLAGIAGTITLMLLDRLPERFRRFKLVRGLVQFAADTRSVFLNWSRAVPVLALSILGHANLSLCVFILARSLDIDVSLIDCLVLVPPVILLMTLPISIAGWGVRETAMVVAFGFVGVPKEAALVLSILFGLVTMAASLPGGLVWLGLKDRRVGESPETTPA